MGPRPVRATATRNTAGLVWGPREPATPQPPRATDAARAMCQWRCHSRLGPRGRPRGWTRGGSRWLAVAEAQHRRVDVAVSCAAQSQSAATVARGVLCPRRRSVRATRVPMSTRSVVGVEGALAAGRFPATW